jgi:hypothetical protein
MAAPSRTATHWKGKENHRGSADLAFSGLLHGSFVHNSHFPEASAHPPRDQPLVGGWQRGSHISPVFRHHPLLCCGNLVEHNPFRNNITDFLNML